MVDYKRLLYALVILLLYVPMVFLGANVFFPKDDFHDKRDLNCYDERKLIPVGEIAPEQDAAVQECLDDQNEAWETARSEKRQYDAWKYLFIVLMNFVALAVVLWVPLEHSVLIGLFFGAVFSTFVATLVYFDTKSRLGFTILVVLFLLVVTFIHKKGKDFL